MTSKICKFIKELRVEERYRKKSKGNYLVWKVLWRGFFQRKPAFKQMFPFRIKMLPGNVVNEVWLVVLSIKMSAIQTLVFAQIALYGNKFCMHSVLLY